MPFASNADIPRGARNALPGPAQTIWRNAFNQASAKGMADSSASRQAWGAVKGAGYVKNEATGRWTKKRTRKVRKARGGEPLEPSKAFDKCFDPETPADLRKFRYDEDLGIAFGWGIVCTIDGKPYFDRDRNGPEHITEAAMLSAATDFMEKSRVLDEMHEEGTEDGQSFVHSFPLTREIAKGYGIETRVTGWLLGVRPSNGEILEKFKDGTYKGFSIAGERDMETIEEVDLP